RLARLPAASVLDRHIMAGAEPDRLCAAVFLRRHARRNGSRSCRDWTDNHRHTDTLSLTDDAWLPGSLWAYSLYSGDEMDLPDQGARNSWASNYCRNHSLDLIYTAADQLIVELIKRKS